MFHLDAYRIESALEAEDLDLDAMLAEGPLVIEWPERVAGILPDERLWVSLEYVSEEHRDLVFSARGARFETLLATFRQAAYGVG
jgi:tRNA A37 threonylcarbamoyladenosine biosynthesis protein TsaE